MNNTVSENTAHTDNPLVSIIVITYNSSQYVLETLESARAQTYQNIELIVSDDCSTDDTVEICRKWIDEYEERFVRAELITVEKNSGIPANCNRGVKSATGEWIKLIAGDDLLLTNSIKVNVGFVNNNKKVKVLFSRMLVFKTIKNEKSIISSYPLASQISKFNKKAESQYKSILSKNFIWVTPSSFIHCSVFEEIGRFDENYPMYEDYPFWLNITSKGTSLYYMDKKTVMYRKEFSTTSSNKYWINERYFNSRKRHFEDKVAEELKIIDHKMYTQRINWFKLHKILIKVFRNRKNILSKIFFIIFKIISKTNSIKI